MLWFERWMGFAEGSPEEVRAKIELREDTLISRINARRIGCGRLSLPSLGELRDRVGDPRRTTAGEPVPPSTLREVVGETQALHRDPTNAGALFQVASQFNLLEMVDPSVTPEEGVGIYEHDGTQGPASAIACGGGTIYRNYFVPVAGGLGQTATRQIDCLAELERSLGGPGLWEMRNGYALPSTASLKGIATILRAASESELDALRRLLRIGVQAEVEVLGTAHQVTQVYGSALPVTYGEPPIHLWEPLARLVLEASYEATLLAARDLGIATVYLTLLGGGVFGNDPLWIVDAILRAQAAVPGLDLRVVSYRRSNPLVQRLLAGSGASPLALSTVEPSPEPGGAAGG